MHLHVNQGAKLSGGIGLERQYVPDSKPAHSPIQHPTKLTSPTKSASQNYSTKSPDQNHSTKSPDPVHLPISNTPTNQPTILQELPSKLKSHAEVHKAPCTYQAYSEQQ